MLDLVKEAHQVRSLSLVVALPPLDLLVSVKPNLVALEAEEASAGLEVVLPRLLRLAASPILASNLRKVTCTVNNNSRKRRRISVPKFNSSTILQASRHSMPVMAVVSNFNPFKARHLRLRANMAGFRSKTDAVISDIRAKIKVHTTEANMAGYNRKSNSADRKCRYRTRVHNSPTCSANNRIIGSLTAEMTRGKDPTSAKMIGRTSVSSSSATIAGHRSKRSTILPNTFPRTKNSKTTDGTMIRDNSSRKIRYMSRRRQSNPSLSLQSSGSKSQMTSSTCKRPVRTSWLSMTKRKIRTRTAPK